MSELEYTENVSANP